MPTILIPTYVQQVQIEDFPADVQRTVKGAMHIRPGTMEVTDGELKHLQKKHEKALRGMTVLPEAPKADEADQASPPTSVPSQDVFTSSNPDSSLDSVAPAADDDSRGKKKSRG